MEYLANWRMLLAGYKLANSSDSISGIARSVGYELESAFSTVFKRIMGWTQVARDHSVSLGVSVGNPALN